MRTVMVAGRTGCGKTTFCQALAGLEHAVRKTQAVEILNAAIDTPGEYLENRRFYKALLVTSIEAEVIILMQDCTDPESMFPPAFASMFSGKPVIGVVSKIDLGTPDSAERAADILGCAGADPVFRVDSIGGAGVDAVRSLLTEE